MPRRSRFTVTVSPDHSNEIERRVILAYGPTDAREFYAKAGYVVLEVRRGDYRKEAVRAKVKAEAPGFALNRAAIAEAIELLGIKWPVHFVYNGRVGNTNGNHSLRYTGGRCRHINGKIRHLDDATRVEHRIMLKTYLTAEKAGRAIWHELTHAMQAEREAAAVGASSMREINEAWHFCSAKGRGTGYNLKPIEIEARDYEPFNDDLPLAR